MFSRPPSASLKIWSHLKINRSISVQKNNQKNVTYFLHSFNLPLISPSKCLSMSSSLLTCKCSLSGSAMGTLIVKSYCWMNCGSGTSFHGSFEDVLFAFGIYWTFTGPTGPIYFCAAGVFICALDELALIRLSKSAFISYSNYSLSVIVALFLHVQSISSKVSLFC